LAQVDQAAPINVFATIVCVCFFVMARFMLPATNFTLLAATFVGSFIGLVVGVRLNDKQAADFSKSNASIFAFEKTTLFPKVPGYILVKKASCHAKTMDQGRLVGDGLEDIAMECRQRCEWNPHCECFELSGSGLRCRISISSGPKTKQNKKHGQGVAYVRDPTYVDPDEVCKSGEHQKVDGSCSEYLVCEKGQFERRACPDGLAFDEGSGKCTWPTAVPSCKSLAEYELTPLTCRSEYLLAAGNSTAMQQWIKLEMDRWWEKVSSNPDVYKRSEGRAAMSILRTAGIEITSKDDAGSKTSRWALFSRDAGGALHMQSVALVEQVERSERHGDRQPSVSAER